MISKAVVVSRILAYLNGELAEADLVRWAEDAFVALTESDDEIDDEALMLDILGYLGAGDSPDFPLTWGVPTDFLESLGTRVQVIARTA
ncbi:MAG: hypothetical protein IAE80_08470 [Anaerolinea sp.]|nr:hypothetical protein [Anaerolinea sp.]